MAFSEEQKAEIIERVCEALLNGISVREVCKEPGMPNRSTILRWLAEEGEFASTIARARELQADAHFDDIDAITQDLLDGKIDSNTAKTAIWAKQWQASKLKPKKYGDKLQTEVTGANGGPLLVVNRIAPAPENDPL